MGRLTKWPKRRFAISIEEGEKNMKYVIGLYVVMIIMVAVNLIIEFILKGDYSALASWSTIMLFLLGTIFFANARYFLSKSN